MLLLKILGGLAALSFGIWLGLPGPERMTPEEVEKLLEDPDRQRRRVRRHFTPLDLFARVRRQAPLPSSRPRFRLAAPDEAGRRD